VVDDPDPWRQPISAAASSSSTMPSRSPFSDRHPASKPTVTVSASSGACSGPGDELEDVVLGRVAEVLDPAPSEERPQRLSSIE
jgi:hypothetical protein